MIKVQAVTLEEAITQASSELQCSITDMKYEVIQHPKKGFLGFGKKPAVIVAGCAKATQQPSTTDDAPSKEPKKQQTPQPIATNPAPPAPSEENPQSSEETTPTDDAEPEESAPDNPHYRFGAAQEDQIISGFYESKQSIHDALPLIEQELNHLFADTCYALDPIKISAYDDHTVYIEFSGEDAALLIGKEGYRYKALSYLLFNWINAKHGYMLRLEIAEFLKNQEEMIANYLAPLITRIKEEGRGQTKPLDGVLAHIALKQLREAFPDKYVSFRQKGDGDRFVVVSSHHRHA